MKLWQRFLVFAFAGQALVLMATLASATLGGHYWKAQFGLACFFALIALGLYKLEHPKAKYTPVSKRPPKLR